MSKHTRAGAHTPGPWKIRGKAIDTADCKIGIAWMRDESHYKGNSKVSWVANARLIAAAPELLEACRAALKALNEYQSNCFENSLLNKAIAKAEGRE